MPRSRPRETEEPPLLPAGGLPELKQAIVAKTKRDDGVRVEPAQVPSNGVARRVPHVRDAAGPGRRVLLPAPCRTTYPEAIGLAGGVPVEVLADETQDYKVTVEQLEAARTDKTKALLFCSPSNPTGAVDSPSRSRPSASGRSRTVCGWSPTRSTST